MNVNVMMQYVTYGLAMIGGLAFLVSIIVQVIKELPFLKKIPTSVVALVASHGSLPCSPDHFMYILQDKDYLVLYHWHLLWLPLLCIWFQQEDGKK